MARKNWEERARERFQARQDNYINKPLKSPKIEPKKFYPFPEYPDDIIVSGYKQSKGERYILYLDLARGINLHKPIIFEEFDPAEFLAPRKKYSIYNSLINYMYFPIFISRLVNFKIIESEIYCEGASMARVQEIIISNGDTDDWVRVDFETFSESGRTLLSFLKLTISGSAKVFDIKRKCWFIQADTIEPFLVGVRILIAQNSLSGYFITDKRIKSEDFDSFFNSAPPSSISPTIDKKTLLRELEHICKEQAGVMVSIREDADILGLKPYYRKAALALHPDRNNGDGSRMSHLNMIWGQLQQLS